LPLIPSAKISQEFSESIIKEIELFHRAVLREIKQAFSGTAYAMDANVASDSRIRLNKLRMDWNSRFNELAKSSVGKMIEKVKKNSTVTINMSLRTISKEFEIDTSFSDQRLQDVIIASTQEAANLIKLIPEKYLAEVQGAVMRSITSGQGMKDLVPFLTKKYQGDIKWARHVALDQTRKAYTSINRVRLNKAGVESFIWRHTGGSAHPRKDHIALSGKEFRYDDPPIIDNRSGEKGFPSQLPFCRCLEIPVFSFLKSESK